MHLREGGHQLRREQYLPASSSVVISWVETSWSRAPVKGMCVSALSSEVVDESPGSPRRVLGSLIRFGCKRPRRPHRQRESPDGRDLSSGAAHIKWEFWTFGGGFSVSETRGEQSPPLASSSAGVVLVAACSLLMSWGLSRSLL